MQRLFFKKLLQKEEVKEPVNEEVNPSITNHHATIGKMAAFFAHEIRNPLTSIIGFSKYLGNEPIIKSDPSIAHYISIIYEEATRMELLIQELLTLSKSNLDHDNLSIIDVKHSIEKIVTINRMQHENNLRFNLSLLDDIYITGNTDRFERLLINLINNSMEAIEKSGVIDIMMSKEDHSLILSIIDNGPGIPPEQLEQIFYPFYTTKDEGTGIGLSICKTIIETLNGTMTIQNHPTKGVHVRMKIPLSQHTKS